MENNTLSAKQWLDKIDWEVDKTQGNFTLDAMEQYADYKTKMLEGRILEFQKHLFLSSYPESNKNILDLYEDFNKHFNITLKRKGKIE